MKTAVIYLRRSTDRQEQSIADQRRHVQAYADREGYEIVGEYLDDAISGTTSKDRPAFQHLMRDSQMPSRKFDHILVYDVKRFGRVDNDEAGYFRYLLRQNGVEIVYTSEPLSGTDSDDLLLPMLQWNARRESKDLSKVTIRGQVSTAQDGWWMGGVPPYGYDLMYYDSEGKPLIRVHYHHSGNKHLCKPNGDLERIIPGGDKIITSKRDRARLIRGDAGEVSVVRRIFDHFVREGHGYKKIASSLNRDGIPTSRKGRWARTPRRLWQMSAVRNILLNQAYAGDSVWNRRTEGKFHRISDRRAVIRKRVGVIEQKPAQGLDRPSRHARSPD